MMPGWIKRWITRWESKFPDCAVRCELSDNYGGYILELYYPKEHAWNMIGNWKTWVVCLNPSFSPAVRQNRLQFRNETDLKLRGDIDKLRDEWARG